MFIAPIPETSIKFCIPIGEPFLFLGYYYSTCLMIHGVCVFHNHTIYQQKRGIGFHDSVENEKYSLSWFSNVGYLWFIKITLTIAPQQVSNYNVLIISTVWLANMRCSPAGRGFRPFNATYYLATLNLS